MKPQPLVGDEALDDLVDEEHRRNSAEEKLRLAGSQQSQGWFSLGKVVAGAFDYSGKSDYDLQFLEVKQFITTKIDTLSLADNIYQEQIR